MTKDELTRRLRDELEDIESERFLKVEAAQAAHLRRLQAFEDGELITLKQVGDIKISGCLST